MIPATYFKTYDERLVEIVVRFQIDPGIRIGVSLNI